jgi:hypothetical protein
MARPAIIEKLEQHLQYEMTTEAAVVYFLVEVRKVLEHDSSKGAFDVLNFYCNWVVHTKLEASPVAERIIRLMDDMHAYMVSKSSILVSVDELRALIDQSSLRTQLAAFLGQVGLSSAVCDSQTNWNNFQRLLGAVIQDTPLFVRKDSKQPTKYIESISIENLPLEDGKSLNFQWTPKFHTYPEGKMRLHPDVTPTT